MKSMQKDDVLLLKKLLKANGLYGAEIKIEGFPGYLCELLILQYGSFSRLISAVNKWTLPKIIDLKKFYKTKQEINELSEKFNSTLVVVDPTDKNRNVAAALSVANLKKFILLCKYFKKNPRDVFFFRSPKTFDQKVKYLKTKGPTYVIALPKPNIVDDVLWGQLKKLMHQLRLHLEKDGFELCQMSLHVPAIIADDSQNKVRLSFSVYDNLLPKTIAIEGPPLNMEKHAKAFRKRHRKAKFIERSERLFAITRRKIRTPEESIKAFFTGLKKQGKSHLAYPLSRIKISKQ
jgi:tRNA nucleotidyltransferase (CCA-adding enzyme)